MGIHRVIRVDIGTTLGVDLDDQNDTLVITKVHANSQAETAGFKPGSIVENVEGIPMRTLTYVALCVQSGLVWRSVVCGAQQPYFSRTVQFDAEHGAVRWCVSCACMCVEVNYIARVAA